jgi:hypothetical protein
MVGCLFAGDCDHRQVEMPTDDGSSVTNLQVLVADGVQPWARRRYL